MVGASMIEVSGAASGSSVASASRLIVVCVTDRLPAVIIAITRSPGRSKMNIFR